MSNPTLEINVAEWVERAKADPITYQQRQTIEIILNAIAMDSVSKLKDGFERRHPRRTCL